MKLDFFAWPVTISNPGAQLLGLPKSTYYYYYYYYYYYHYHYYRKFTQLLILLKLVPSLAMGNNKFPREAKSYPLFCSPLYHHNHHCYYYYCFKPMNVSTAWLKLAISLTLYNISVNNINALILISSSFMVRRLLHCSTR